MAFDCVVSLTKDTVPADVDAVLFWVVWGAKAEPVEVNLNYLGQPGWEVVAADEWRHNGRRLMVIAKHPPAAQRAGQRQAQRRRDWPGTSTATRPQDL